MKTAAILAIAFIGLALLSATPSVEAKKLPNLVANITVTTTNATNGSNGTAVVTVTLFNNGTKQAKRSVLEVYLKGPLDDVDSRERSIDHRTKAIRKGRHRMFSWTFDNLQAGSYEGKVILDVNERVKESDEEDNTIPFVVVVGK